MHELRVDECVKSAQEPISRRSFSDIFAKEFNLHFDHLSLDTRKFCDEWAMKTEAASMFDENSKLRGEHELHLQKAQLAQDKMKKDFGNTQNGDNLWS
jgi:hypothetical protein